MKCPGCRSTPMATERYEGHYGRALELDVCHACNGLWFDGHESLLLTPGATLKLFSSLYGRQEQARAAQVPGARCPRCGGPLEEITDQVKNTRFSYQRCVAHGRFTTLFQWMRERGLVRAPSAPELAELKARIKLVDCSNCGAPIALDETTTCRHCAAPVTILSSEGIEATLKEIHTKEIDRSTLKPEKLIELIALKSKLERSAQGVRVVLTVLKGLFRE